MATNQQTPQQDKTRLLTKLLILGFILIATGIIITIIATVLSSTNTSPSSGVTIFIGPIPIAFGTGPNAAFTLMLAAVFAALTLIALIVMRRRTQKTD